MTKDLQKKRLSDLMLLANLISTIFYSMSCPYVYAETIKVVSKGYLSFEQIFSCLGIVVFGTIWNKYGDTLFKYYSKFVLLETIADTFLFVDVMVRHDLKFYFLLNVIIYSVITKNMCCGGIKMRAKVNSTEEARERYDNNSDSIYAVSTIIGTSLAIAIPTSINTLFVFALIGNVVDNFFYLYIYKKIKVVTV